VTTVPLFVLLFLFCLWAVPALCVGVGQCVPVYIYGGMLRSYKNKNEKTGGGRDGESETENHWDW